MKNRSTRKDDLKQIEIDRLDKILNGVLNEYDIVEELLIDQITYIRFTSWIGMRKYITDVFNVPQTPGIDVELDDETSFNDSNLKAITTFVGITKVLLAKPVLSEATDYCKKRKVVHNVFTILIDLSGIDATQLANVLSYLPSCKATVKNNDKYLLLEW